MLDFERLLANQPNSWLTDHYAALSADLAEHYSSSSHGRHEEWVASLNHLPDIVTNNRNLKADAIQIGSAEELSPETQNELEITLKGFKPWRKGPFDLFGVHINTEWRSDWKWQRLKPHISPLDGRLVLDVGCGNGYHCLRMRGEGAAGVLGIDPTRLFLFQFDILKRWLPNEPVYLLPLKSEQLNLNCAFDTVFSMGVLYHRRDPVQHLRELFNFLQSGGELVLESLIIEGEKPAALTPENRYAQMRNVFPLPTPPLLLQWLEQAGFVNMHLVDINQTSIEEQRSTEWMDFQSLEDFLDPSDTNKTIEGHPAPRRGIVIATKP